MNDQGSDIVASLLTFLEKDCGFILEGQQTFEAFGDRLLTLRAGNVSVRLGRDRGDWFAEICSTQKPGEWYDVALLKEQITGQVGNDVLPFDEQAAYLRANWNRIVSIFAGPGAEAVHTDLEHRRHERAKRLFPKWCP